MGPGLQPLRDYPSRFVDPLHPQGEGHTAPENLPRVEGTDHGANIDLRLVADAIHGGKIVGNDGSSLSIPVPVDEFRQSLHHKVRAKLKGLLVIGGKYKNRAQTLHSAPFFSLLRFDG